jgi:hypothetical protein
MRAGCLIVACGDVFIQARDQAIVSLKIVNVDASLQNQSVNVYKHYMKRTFKQ